MVLDEQKIKELIEKGTSPEIIEARKRAKMNNMHVTGHKMLDYLEIIDSYENETQLALREKLAKSNKSMFNWLLKPMDKIFTAKGGSVNYNLTREELKAVRDKLTESSDHLELKRYLRKIVRLPYIIDPNGLLFVELDRNGMASPDIKTTENIMWYAHKGNRVEAVIFEGYFDDNDLTHKDVYGEPIYPESKDRPKYYRVYDDDSDRLFKWDGEKIELVDEYQNYFGYVPGMILGDEKDPNIDIYNSLIYEVVEDANQFLRRASTMNVHELSHLYSRYWSYAQACTRCEGEGWLRYDDGDDQPVETKCPSCAGSGVKTRTNPSDETVVPIPQEGEPIITPHIAGYVSPDIAIAKFYQELQTGMRTEMFQTLWGTTYQTDKNRETALARFIDAKPVEDKLRDVSATFESFHEFLLNAFVSVILGKPDYRSTVAYGNRYILESADAILKEYKEASRESISEVVMLDLKVRYFEAEYQTDSVELGKRKKLMKIEPFPTLGVSQVFGMQDLPEKEKLRKLYFSQWVGSLKDSQIILFTEDKLRKSLDEYISELSLTPQKPENEQII